VLSGIQQPVTPVMVKIVGAPTQEVGVVDILVSGLGLTGVLLIARRFGCLRAADRVRAVAVNLQRPVPAV
jgi:hypothetical protein